MKLLRKERFYERLDARVAGGRNSIDPDKSWPFDRANVAKEGLLGRQLREQANVRLDSVERHRLRERRDDTDARRLRPSSHLLDRVADGLRPHCNFRLVRRWTGDGEHQGCRIAEVALKVDGARALWKPVAEVVQREIDISELFLRVVDILIKLNVDDREPGQRQRLDAIVGGRRRMDVGVLGDLLLDWPGDELLHIYGGTPRPLAHGNCDTHRNIRIIALRHRSIAVHSPQDSAKEQHPGHLPMLGEEAPAVARLLEDLRVTLVCHGM